MAEVSIHITVDNAGAFQQIITPLDKLRSTMESLNRTGSALSGNVVQAVESLNERIGTLSDSMGRLAESTDEATKVQKMLLFVESVIAIGAAAKLIGRLTAMLRNLGKTSSTLSGLGPKLRSFFSAFKLPAGVASRIKDLFSVIGNFASSVLGRLAGAARSIGAFFASFRLPAGLVTRMRGLFTLVGGFFRLLLPRLAFLARFLGPVGLAVSAFFAGWKIGKLVAELEVGGMKIKYWVEGIFIFWSEMFAKIPIHAKKMWLELKLKFHEGINSLLGFADKLPEKLKKMLGIEGALIEQTA